ncbi:hypothetical protein F4860DRAFT_492800 [Xylaria cubensis]|nr:hypothetical protein F4860DRAFT_492800 [Xylaria cubensis]
MPARSAVSLLAAPAPAPIHCLFLYPPSTLSTSRRPRELLFPKSTIPSPRRRNAFLRTNGRRPFHNTAARQDDAIDNARNHYETLKIAPTASPADIKKSFYNLSKTHHPDLHEAAARRTAAKRFMRISEAYSILSSPTKRSKYDREHMGLSSTAAQHTHKGSYSSTGPAGGRPASGLSRRRGTFQGPPPSFYRSGGWGAQGEKRRAAHEESTGMGGMGPGQDPFGHRDDVPHFDKEGHQRTGRHSDKRREARRAATTNDEGRQVAIEPERGVAGMFFAIGGVLLLSFVVPFVVSQIWYGAARKPKEKDDAAKRKG